MNGLMMALILGQKGVDKARLADYLRADRAQKEKDYAKIARGVIFAAYYFTGSLKMNVNVGGASVPATDASVSDTSKLNALLSGTAEIWRAIPYFGLLSEAATFIGEVIARSTTMDPMMIELLAGNNGMGAPAQTITLQAPPPRGNYAQPQTLRLTSPTGSSTGMRITAQGIEIEDPNWRVSVD